jgi:hypothetical protein
MATLGIKCIVHTPKTLTKDEHKHKSGRQYFSILKTLSEKKAEKLIVGLSHHPPPPLIDCQRWGAELCFFSCVAQSIFGGSCWMNAML